MWGSYTLAGLIIVKKKSVIQILLSKYRYKNIMRNQLEIKKSPIPTPYYTKLPWLNLNIQPIVLLIASKFQPLFVFSAILLSSIFFQ